MKVTVIGNKSDTYVNPVNNCAYMDKNKIMQAENYKDVDFDGANNLVIRMEQDGKFRIVQVGGWSYNRGMFVDLY